MGSSTSTSASVPLATGRMVVFGGNPRDRCEFPMEQWGRIVRSADWRGNDGPMKLGCQLRRSPSCRQPATRRQERVYSERDAKPGP